nr:PilZ domain-containing protein [Deltaproteobacteria bacterium]
MGSMDSSERREYFRVADVFPMVAKKIDKDATPLRSHAFPTLSSLEFDEEILDESINPKLWEILLHIDTKLTLILEKLCIECDGLTEENNRAVGLSEASLDFTTTNIFELGDVVEIKMLLPSTFPARIQLYGKVTRIDAPASGTYKVVVRFVAADQTVRSILRKYILKRQREMIAQESGLND